MFYLLFRLYKEEKVDGSSSGVKWSCPNIHDLFNILRSVQVDLILQSVFDKRLVKLENLSVLQLKDECSTRNLEKTGKKVFMNLLS